MGWAKNILLKFVNFGAVCSAVLSVSIADSLAQSTSSTPPSSLDHTCAGRRRRPAAKALEVSRPLHVGNYGGMPLKVIWLLLDLATIAVLASGLYLWLSRRRSLTAEAEAELLESRMPASLAIREAAE